jgi:hypothetical protein
VEYRGIEVPDQYQGQASKVGSDRHVSPDEVRQARAAASQLNIRLVKQLRTACKGLALPAQELSS